MATQQNQQELDLSSTPYLQLKSAFLAMEPSDALISFARECGNGFVGERVQSFIWHYCIGETVKNGLCQGDYVKMFLKKLIAEIESDGDIVLDELYEHYAFIMTCSKDDDFAKGKSRVVKKISFLFPGECAELRSCPKSRKLEISLQCSLNLLEGDTGCSIWPSSLFLSEFVLSFPEVFFNKSCLEVGSGVGLLGVCLAHVKASAIILSDGDLSTLENMRLNLDKNLHSTNNYSTVQCVHLPWESASENELRNYAPNLVLGADVIYDPLYLPHLVRVLSILLKGRTSYPDDRVDLIAGSQPDSGCMKSELNNASVMFEMGKERVGTHSSTFPEQNIPASETVPVAYIASVIRNIDTFNHFLHLTEQAKLTVTDITQRTKPFNLLPYAKSYPRSSIQIFRISYLYL